MTRSPRTWKRPSAERRRGLIAGGRWRVLGATLGALACILSIHPAGDGAAAGPPDGPWPPQLAWGEPARGEPRAVVILLHGGGWQPNPNGFEVQAQIAKAVHAWGFATAAVGYSAGAQGLREIVTVYEAARRRYPGVPVCAVGDSSGGHLALMLAVRKPSLSCAVDRVGPTDLESLAAQGASVAHQYAVDAFGAESLARFSPVRYAGRIDAEVLMILAENDPLVPLEQGWELVRVLPGAELLVLPPGPVPWFHESTVTETGLAKAKRRPWTFVRKATMES